MCSLFGVTKSCLSHVIFCILVQSLKRTTTLSLPVEHRVLKALIDFIYNDEFKEPTQKGAVGNLSIDYSFKKLSETFLYQGMTG